MNENFVKFITKIYYKFPILRPYILFLKRIFFFKPTFSGGAMKTEATLPWDDKYNGYIFRKANTDLKKFFKFYKDKRGIDVNTVEDTLWRNWIVSYSTRHAIEFADHNNFNFIECGVGDGVSAFFTLREISAQKNSPKFSMHLYDSWVAMRQEDLLQSELSKIGKYDKLNFDITERNLSEFKDHIIYHPGFIPESFNKLPESPHSIVYLHIDLNSAKPTLAALNFFYPKLVRGGVILFDDYGWREYKDTKKVVDEFFSNKPGILLKLATGQAIYYR